MHLPEVHRTQHIGWLRAAVMGANDGIVSTASLLVGVAAAQVSRQNLLVAGLAGMIAGAMSMAAGEYVSVSTQSDVESADLKTERQELIDDYDFEVQELANIYTARGLDESLARQVAAKLMEHDALDAHARDELGISEIMTARPIQAALTSAATFTVGALLPLLVTVAAPPERTVVVVAAASLASLALLGGLAARTAGAPVWKSVWRVTFWGMLAMGITAAVGSLFGVVG